MKPTLPPSTALARGWALSLRASLRCFVALLILVLCCPSASVSLAAEKGTTLVLERGSSEEPDDDRDNSGSGSGEDDDRDDRDDEDNSGPGSNGDHDDRDNSGSGSSGDDDDRSGGGNEGRADIDEDRIRREGRDREVQNGIEAELNARWEQRDDRTILRVQVRNLAVAGQSLTVCVMSGSTGALLVESRLALNGFGFGEWKLDSRQGDQVPLVQPGDKVNVRDGACSSGVTPLLAATIGGGAVAGVTPSNERIRREGRARDNLAGVQAELNARWEQRDDRTIFRAQVRNLLIGNGAILDVCVAGGSGGAMKLSGQLRLDNFGFGEFKLDTRNGDEVPAIAPGDIVTVQQGSCFSAAAPLLSATIAGGASAVPRESDRLRREGRDRRIIEGAQVELNARWEERDDRTTFRVEVERFLSAQGELLAVCVVDVLSGAVKLEGRLGLNLLGNGEWKLDSRNGDAVPMVQSGDVVNVQRQPCGAGAPLLSATIRGGSISDQQPAASCGLATTESRGDDTQFLVVASGVDAEDGSLDAIVELFALDSEGEELLVAMLEDGDKVQLHSGRPQIRVETADGQKLVDDQFEVRAEASSFRLSCTVEDSQGMVSEDDVTVAPGVSTSVRVARNGIVNGASFISSSASEGSVAPGSIVSLFGEFDARPSQARQVPLPNSLEGVSVTVNGVPAPLFFVSPGQINAQLPWNALAAGQSSGLASVKVTSGGVSSAARTIRVGGAAPGVFTLAAGAGPAVAVNLDGTLAQPRNSVPGLPARPARVGESLVIFATGLGPTTAPVPAGYAPDDRIVRTATPPVVLIGGREAKVTFSGLSPQFVGVNQLNVVVPDVPAGRQLPLQLRIGALSTSDDVTIAVE